LIRGARRDDPDSGVRAGQRVDAPLDRAVAAPHEHQIDTILECAPSALAGLAALGHLVPDGVVESLLCDQLSEFAQTAAQRFLPMGDDRDPFWRCGRELR
jgi:hypothetical protein